MERGGEARLARYAGKTICSIERYELAYNFLLAVFGTYVAIKVVQWICASAFVVLALAFATIYYFAPNAKEQHWYWITPGSLVGAIMWGLVSAGLRLYLHFSNS